MQWRVNYSYNANSVDTLHEAKTRAAEKERASVHARDLMQRMQQELGRGRSGPVRAQKGSKDDKVKSGDPKIGIAVHTRETSIGLTGTEQSEDASQLLALAAII